MVEYMERHRHMPDRDRDMRYARYTHPIIFMLAADNERKTERHTNVTIRFFKWNALSYRID